jgi:hypothetical protein
LANTAVVYGREYRGKIHTFEASGGLMHSALVMQDRETDSYWSIMTGDAIAGELKGTQLQELPTGVKMQWKDWVKRHPNTLVLSVAGIEDVLVNPYDNYFSSKEGYRGAKAPDKRLKTKEPIFSFQLEGQKLAVPLKKIEGGKTFDLGKIKIFLYRPPRSAFFHSTIAYKSNGAGFKKEKGTWHDLDSGCKFNPENSAFENGQAPCPERLEGFDTFWYNWGLTHPDTEVLGK